MLLFIEMSRIARSLSLEATHYHLFDYTYLYFHQEHAAFEPHTIIIVFSQTLSEMSLLCSLCFVWWGPNDGEVQKLSRLISPKRRERQHQAVIAPKNVFVGVQLRFNYMFV